MCGCPTKNICCCATHTQHSLTRQSNPHKAGEQRTTVAHTRQRTSSDAPPWALTPHARRGAPRPRRERWSRVRSDRRAVRPPRKRTACSRPRCSGPRRGRGLDPRPRQAAAGPLQYDRRILRLCQGAYLKMSLSLCLLVPVGPQHKNVKKDEANSNID